jgi:RNA polymerase sigma-70 factor (ECF subfamily)
MEDAQIIELYLQRDESAISQTKEQYGTRLRRISMNIVNDSQTAEECESDTYLQAWNTIPPNEPRHYLFAFLARIIRHISIDCCRYRERLCRAGYVQELSAELQAVVSGNDDVESRMDAIMLGESISAFLRTQPEMVRNVFIRRYWYMDSIAQISARYSITPSKTKSILFRCRNALRIHLEKEGYRL